MEATNISVESKKSLDKVLDSKANFLNASTPSEKTPASSQHVVENDTSEDEQAKEEETKMKCLRSSAQSDNHTEDFIDWGSDISWPEVNIPGTWGTQALEEQPWIDYKKPYTKFRSYNDLQLDENESKGILTDRIIAACSSYLDKSPETGKYVLCKVILSKKILKDIRIIGYHHYLQYVDLSWNELTNVTALGQLPFLMYLDVSHNSLTKALNFKAPFNLTYVNYSYNLINELQELSDFWSIVHLDLSHNNISAIEGLQEQKYLRHLNLSFNVIECLENLNHMKLQTLNLQNNKIESFQEEGDVGFKTLNDILHVNLGHNCLKTLRLFSGITGIQSINFSENLITDLMEINYLRGLSYLTEIDFRGNPIVKMKYYIDVCLTTMKTICNLDGDRIEASRKILAKDHFDLAPQLQAAKNAAKTLFLQQVNDPILGCPVIPYDQFPPPIIVLVGPPGSNKGKLVHQLCSKHKIAVKGISHTTREKHDDEINGEHYHFVNEHTFRKMANNGEFLTASQILGHSFALAESEINKVIDKPGVLILHTNLIGALTLRVKSLRCILVLAMTSNADIHKQWVLEKYYNSNKGNLFEGAIEVENNPTKAKDFLEQCNQLLKTNTEEMARELVENVVQKITKNKDVEVEIVDSPENVSIHSCKSEKGDKSGLTLAPQESTQDLTKTKSKQFSSGILKTPSSKTKTSVTETPINSNTQYARTSVTFHNDQTEKPTGSSSLNHYARVQASRSVTFSDQHCNSLTEGNAHFSVSGTLVRGPGYESVVLSVLSQGVLSNKDLPTDSDTYDMQIEAIKVVTEDIIKSRDVYFELHYSNPGLFSEVIFTDEWEESLKKLKSILKQCVLTQPKAKQQYEYKKDLVYQTMVATRLITLHKEINNELSTTQKQRAVSRHIAKSRQLKGEPMKFKKDWIEKLARKRHHAIKYQIPKETKPFKPDTSSDDSEDGLC